MIVTVDNIEHEVNVDSFKELAIKLGKTDFVVDMHFDTFWALFIQIYEIRKSYNEGYPNYIPGTVAYCFGFYITHHA